jgi:hypothetical protein
MPIHGRNCKQYKRNNTGGEGGGGQTRPWVLGILIHEGVELKNTAKIGLFHFFCLHITQTTVLKTFLYSYLTFSTYQPKKIIHT